MPKSGLESAKSNLAFSQNLLDQMRQKQMAEEQMNMMGGEMSAEEPVIEEEVVEETPQQEVQEEAQEEKTIVDTIKETIAPYMEKIQGLLAKKEEGPQEVEIKIDGEMAQRVGEEVEAEDTNEPEK